jgi:hypothetical protein
MRNSVVLPAPFGPMTPTMPPAAAERQVVEQQPVAEALLQFSNRLDQCRPAAGPAG